MNKLKKILVLNGPNLNLLGKREPKIYGNVSLNEIENDLSKLENKLSIGIHCFQNNNEGELIEIVQKAYKNYSGIIINAGGFSHTSIALMDALKFFGKPIIEVHMSNIYNREEYRAKSILSKGVSGLIIGFGLKSYDLAISTL